MARKAARKKKVVAAKKEEAAGHPLFYKRPRKFGAGQDLPPKRDLTRFVRWPKYVRVQRQKRVLYARLKVPPAINQFTKTLDKHNAAQIFKFADKYRPETRAAKKSRLTAQAAAQVDGKKAEAGKVPNTVKYGLKHVTALIEQKKASLVLIAHDVEPLEVVMWLPALCRRQGVPYAIVKGKARLGQIVNKKTATVVAFTYNGVNPEDKNDFAKLIEAVKEKYNSRSNEIVKAWGGQKLGRKSNEARLKKEKARARELKL